MQNRRKVLKSVVNLGPRIIEAHKAILLAEYTEKEVKEALFSIPGIKAPGPGGFGSAFYQDNWTFVRTDFVAVVLSFLSTGKMLKEINTTTITLIPKKIGDWPGYKFHDRCSSLKLNHLCFVDDLLVFSHGDFVSVMLMLRGLKLFSATSGLMPIEQKSAIYCSGMSNEEVGRILEASQFKRSSLPFRYLCIPICSKKISTPECLIILEKMVGRIRVWSIRNLSYMGRVTLINVVLISIHAYWAQILLLPKKLLKEIEAICRSFLWKGIQAGAGPGLVAWE
uniref:Reverse transcriptase n=1 Tax=Cannabis sativa TaxID=3483 RepID=A0A803Q9P7_CANSA